MRVDLVRATATKDLACFCIYIYIYRIYSEPVGLGGHTLQKGENKRQQGWQDQERLTWGLSVKVTMKFLIAGSSWWWQRWNLDL